MNACPCVKKKWNSLSAAGSCKSIAMKCYTDNWKYFQVF